MNLTELNKGEKAVIKQFNEISHSFQRRLYDMGISIGSEIILLDILSFGKLFYISVDDIDFCIRKKEAQNIIIKCI